MGGGGAERIEAGVDRLAAALFAAAVAFAFFAFLNGTYGQPQLGVYSASAAVMVYLLCSRGLRAIPVDERFAVPAFDPPAIDLPADGFVESHIDEFRVIEPQPLGELLLTDADLCQSDELLLTEQVELLLTDADRLTPPRRLPDELVLDDILAELGPDSRVVRLFDPAAMPTPGQLNARIERHLGEGGAPAAPADASQALYDALAELRRSLR